MVFESNSSKLETAPGVVNARRVLVAKVSKSADAAEISWFVMLMMPAWFAFVSALRTESEVTMANSDGSVGKPRRNKA